MRRQRCRRPSSASSHMAHEDEGHGLRGPAAAVGDVAGRRQRAQVGQAGLVELLLDAVGGRHRRVDGHAGQHGHQDAEEGEAQHRASRRRRARGAIGGEHQAFGPDQPAHALGDEVVLVGPLLAQRAVVVPERDVGGAVGVHRRCIGACAASGVGGLRRSSGYSACITSLGRRSTVNRPQCFSGSSGSGEPFQGSSKASNTKHSRPARRASSPSGPGSRGPAAPAPRVRRACRGRCCWCTSRPR